MYRWAYQENAVGSFEIENCIGSRGAGWGGGLEGCMGVGGSVGGGGLWNVCLCLFCVVCVYIYLCVCVSLNAHVRLCMCMHHVQSCSHAVHLSESCLLKSLVQSPAAFQLQVFSSVPVEGWGHVFVWPAEVSTSLSGGGRAHVHALSFLHVFS